MQDLSHENITDAPGLVAAGDMAAEAGFSMPVHLTAAAWADSVAWTVDDSRLQLIQYEHKRLWHVLDMAAHAFVLSLNTVPASGILFPVLRIPRDGYSRQSCETTLKTVLVTDSDHPSVIIMLMGE